MPAKDSRYSPAPAQIPEVDSSIRNTFPVSVSNFHFRFRSLTANWKTPETNFRGLKEETEGLRILGNY